MLVVGRHLLPNRDAAEPQRTRRTIRELADTIEYLGLPYSNDCCHSSIHRICHSRRVTSQHFGSGTGRL
jgi:hypothetical protein